MTPRKLKPTPWRTPIGGPVESLALEPKVKPSTDSWWLAYASAETTFEAFQTAARNRDVVMSATSWSWRAQKAQPNT